MESTVSCQTGCIRHSNTRDVFTCQQALVANFTDFNFNLLLRVLTSATSHVRECNQKFPDWPPGARTANGIALCHWVQLYRYFVSQSSEFCRHNLLCCFSTSFYCCKRIFRYKLSPETFGYTLVCR
jgi:hypothetical protein